VKTNKQPLAGWKLRHFFRSAGRARLGLVILAGLAGGICHVAGQGTFGNPIVISGAWGNISQDNTGFTAPAGEPSIAGATPNAPVWFQWTAPQDGVVEMDTIGSGIQSFNGNLYPLDTVLGVYIGTSLASVNQVSANDDLFPAGGISSIYQINDSGSGDYAKLFGAGSGVAYFGYYQPHYGPSGLRFNAKGGTTYLIVVDTKSSSIFSYFPTGPISLNWAYKSSGVFSWATEDEDYFTELPLYQTSESETSGLAGNDNSVNSVVLTYYNYNAPGLLVTVTRTAGSTGRATVDYTTVDGASLSGSAGYVGYDVSAYAYYTNIIVSVDSTLTNEIGRQTVVVSGDYSPVSGQLVFDDHEMSKTILIPISPDAGTVSSGGTTVNPGGGYLSNPFYTTNVVGGGGVGGPPGPVTLPSHNNNNLFNADFGVMLSNPQLDPSESGDVSQPRVDSQFSTALVRILNTGADPYGPDYVHVVSTNGFSDPPTNSIPILVTNLVLALYPTNAVFNFEKANYRVPADVDATWTKVTLWVERFGTNGSAETLNYRINNFLGNDKDASEEENARFPLQPGSDYAVPTPPSTSLINGRNSDFNMAQGTIAFPDSGAASVLQPITFTVTNSSLTKFNKDFKIELYQEKSIGGHNLPVLVGMNAETTVTILFNDQNPPAGSVDELYNADFNSDLALPPGQIPQTWPVNNLNNPGVSGQVYGLAVLTNDETIIAGNFSTYNGVAQNNLALLNTDGSMDTSFNPGGSANAAVNAIAISGSQFVVGGAFTSYNGTGVGDFARLNADGSLDTGFSTSQGSGADNTVRAVAVQPDGKVVIGGDFTHVDGVVRNYLARLNGDGSLDTSFDPGNTLNGSVYALALPQSAVFQLTRHDTNGPSEDDEYINLGSVTSGTLTISYNHYIYSNTISIFYGGINVAVGAGVQIGGITNVPGTGSLVIPFGPTVTLPTVSTNQLVIVMNPGGATFPVDAWKYTATVTVPSGQGVLVGGQFNVAGQLYANIARFTTNGVLDTTFNPGTGTDDRVLALGWQPNNQIVAGGVFMHVNGSPFNHLVRFNADGSIDTTNFFVGTGADDVVYNITLQPLFGSIYVGGAFSSFNGTHRLGFTRLYANGTVDTTFLDMAYDQFAGLKRIYSYDSPAVYASGFESGGNVLDWRLLRAGGWWPGGSKCLQYFGL
jgi:uncharacterized delta-60 repeat protein